VLNAPDVKSMIASIPAGSSRVELLSGLIEEQLTQSVSKNLLNQIIARDTYKVVPSVSDKSCDNATFGDGHNVYQESEELLPGSSEGKILGSDDSSTLIFHPSSKFVPLEPTIEQPKISLLGSYVKNLFNKNEIKYCDEDSSERNEMLLIDYKAKYLLRDDHQRILPLMARKANINQEFYCGICRQEFVSLAEKCTHEKSYLHQMISGDWWTKHIQPPKYIPMFINNVRCERMFIWCIICFEKHGIDTNEQLFQHLKSSHHQFNMYCWKECYDTWPLHEWCLWKDVQSFEQTLPRSITVDGFDWSNQVKFCILPDEKI